MVVRMVGMFGVKSNPKMIHHCKMAYHNYFVNLTRIVYSCTTKKRKEAFTESLGRTVGFHCIS
jgi:hypothetical protein